MRVAANLMCPFFLFASRKYQTILLFIIPLDIAVSIRVDDGVKIDEAPLRYIDSKESFNQEYDRVVSIYIKGNNPTGYLKNSLTICPGILIDSYRVLTAFNPFRQLVKTVAIMSNTYVGVLKNRRYNKAGTTGYKVLFQPVQCGRQVNPMLEDDIPDEQWFSSRRIHSPVHDLIVLRIAPVELIDRGEDFEKHMKEDFELGTYYWDGERSGIFHKYWEYKWDWSSYGWYKYFYEGYEERAAGPLKTELASPEKELRRDFSFVSTGLNNYQTWQATQLKEVIYYTDDNAIIDCEEWLPREWGYFICIANKERLDGVGTGAILFGDDYSCYGIGSFMLERHNESILVFTDVRKYRHLIYDTCIELPG